MSLERTARTLHIMEKDKKTPEDRLLILNKELAMFGYGLVKSKVFPKDKTMYLANAKLDLADAMVQIHMLCYDLEMQPEEVLQLGVQHTWERFQDFEDQGWGKDFPPEIDSETVVGSDDPEEDAVIAEKFNLFIQAIQKASDPNGKILMTKGLFSAAMDGLQDPEINVEQFSAWLGMNFGTEPAEEVPPGFVVDEGQEGCKFNVMYMAPDGHLLQVRNPVIRESLKKLICPGDCRCQTK